MNLLTGLVLGAMGRLRPWPALDASETGLCVVLPALTCLHDAAAHALRLVAPADLRGVTGCASAAAGAIAQNVYLYCASAGLATVIRAWIDRGAVAEALGLPHEHQMLLSQTVGRPKATGRAATLRA